MNNEKVLTMCMGKLLYTPYKWGGENPISGYAAKEGAFNPKLEEGYDCSGVMQELLMTVGLDPQGDQSSQMLYDHFTNPRYGEHHRLEFGSLLFFGKTDDRISHIAMAINKKLMFESAGGGSEITTRKEAIIGKAFVRIRPINKRKDLVAVIYPLGLDEG